MPMNLGLGMGLSRRAAASGGAPFTPASLFASGEGGFYGQVQTSDLWQDVARTTPVTAAGQEVLSWRLRTSGADIYATQTTPGSGPVYRVDGDGAAYLDFATTKALVVPSITPGTDKAQLFAGVMLGSGATRVILETSPITDSNNGSLMLFYLNPATTAQLQFRSKGTIIADAVGPSTTPFNTKLNVAGFGDISGDTSTLRIDKSQVGSVTSDQGSGNFLPYQTFIGGRNGAGLLFGGRIYSLILRYGPNLTAGQVSNAEDWTGSKLNP